MNEARSAKAATSRRKIKALSTVGAQWPPRGEPDYTGCTVGAIDELARMLAVMTVGARGARDAAALLKDPKDWMEADATVAEMESIRDETADAYIVALSEVK